MRFKNLFIFLAISLLGIGIYFSKNVRLDASSDTLILQNDKTFQYFEFYNKIFPSKNFLVLAIKSEKKINENYIGNLNKIIKQLSKIKGIESTFSIADAPILLINNKNFSNLSYDKIENINNSDLELKDILNEFSASPIFKDQIINTEKNISSIIIYTNDNKELLKLKNERKNLRNKTYKEKKIINNKYFESKKINNIQKEKLIHEVRNIINNSNKDYEYFLGGIDMIVSDSISFVKNDIKIFSLAVLIFIIIILFFIYRDIKWVLIPLVTTMYSVIIMTGFIGLTDWEITAISSNFISLMLILSISMNIHIINNYKINFFDKNVIKKLKNTITKIFWPCFYTSLTTIVAFTSLLFSNIKPLIDFGGIMVIALIIILITAFTILPLLIYFFPNIKRNKNLNFLILNNFYNLSIRYTRSIVTINIAVFVISIIGIYKLNVENSFINYFKSNTQIYKGMKIIDTELGGTTPLDILIKFKENELKISNEEITNIEEDLEFNDDLDLGNELFTNIGENKIWFTKDKIETIKRIHEFLESKKEIGKVQSINSLIDMANLINKNEMSIFELSILYNEIPNYYKERLVSPFLSIENNMVKISSRVKDSEEINRKLLIENINQFLKNNFQNIEEFKVNGLLVLYTNMLQSLFNSQIKSFGIILISIFIMFIILFKSLKLSIIAMVPNIIASTLILGLIGLLKIPLDIMTITIAAITIGIAVDNTIHYIYRFKINSINYKAKEDLIKRTHNSVGNAVLTTSVTITLGFSVLCLSSFVPTILFGIFTSLAMMIAMLGVLITLPSLLYKTKI